MIPDDLRYTKDHEWVRVESSIATVGLTDHAQSEMGDVVYVELPKVGESFKRGDVFGVVESVKAASDCYLPVSGAIAEINTALGDAPQKVNEDPYGEGWFVKVKIADPSELEALMSAEDYASLLKEEEVKE